MSLGLVFFFAGLLALAGIVVWLLKIFGKGLDFLVKFSVHLFMQEVVSGGIGLFFVLQQLTQLWS